ASSVALGLAPAIVRAQGTWPDRQVRFIVPFPPGGGTDTVGRIIADQLGKTLGQTFVIDNKGGAGGTVGTVELARAAPDGYTVGMITVGSHGIFPTLYAKLPFDPVKDFTTISMFASLPNLLALHPAVAANTVAELIALLKKNPGKYTFCSSGAGTSLHLSGEMFKQMAGVDMLHVPYKGGGPALIDLLAGQVHMIFGNAPSTWPLVRERKLRGIAVTSPERSKIMPDIPAIAETVPGFAATSWYGLAGPAGVPQPIVDRLEAALREILAKPEVIKRYEDLGTDIPPLGKAYLDKFYPQEIARWAPVVRASGARVE
ncbi:MAG: tripartite tricarboxylate transporter substrate binding protein, partial [Alphaproteobacteria bacterium]|nr:tripartite tricarboxylate transporter substrate binding protein [Alphaproteobacteria bacterium]